ncbi:MAG: dihydrodipicolinate synthase family protein [Lachnospiraceae bacterium]|nr:dihydrodipicolinate synthase family protein [Lachnospiraceae bacterium]
MNIKDGIYPTMITPYKNGEIDYDAVRKLVEFYVEKGCTGIFAVCQSSEMHFLSLKEKVRLASEVVEQAAGRLNVVASGHTSTSLEEQAEEIDAVSETGIDAFVWVSNRLDIHNDGDKVWIQNAEKLLERTNKEIPLGIYECPKPYKRLLSTDILRWCIDTKRFAFIKDTCCDPDLLKERIELLKGSGCKLFNANGQTFLTSVKAGGNGYSGIMANFHPDLYAWLFENFKSRPEEAEELSAILSMAAFTESPAYPCTAKYYLQYEGIQMDTFARSADEKLVTEYQKEVMQQMYHLNELLRSRYISK